LCQNLNRVDSRIDKIVQDKINQWILAAKRDSGLCALMVNWVKPTAVATGKNHSYGFFIAAIEVPEFWL
jgi:hypothetical protein